MKQTQFVYDAFNTNQEDQIIVILVIHVLNNMITIVHGLIIVLESITLSGLIHLLFYSS
jgi:hypothetical protein